MPPRRAISKRARAGSSSSSRTPRVIFDEEQFTSEENFSLFEKLKGNSMIVEKSIAPRIDAETPIRAEFDKFGWGSILEIRGNYYPDLVWQFFENIEEKDTIGLPIIRTFVKQVPIELTTDFLAAFLHVPNDGPFINYNQYDTVFSDPDFAFHATSRRLYYRRERTGTRLIILPTSIPLINCLFCYFISSNNIPRKAGNNELRNVDIYIIDKMINGLGNVSALPVASIILAHMRYVAHLITLKSIKHHAPFAITISKILAACGVDFTGETSLSPAPTHALTVAAMMGMYFICRGGVWYINPDNRNLTCSLRDPLIPAPTRAEQDREERIHEEEALDRAGSSHDASQRSSMAPRGTRGVYSAIFDFLDDLSSRMARLEHHAMNHTYLPDVTAPPYDRSALYDLEEAVSTSNDE